MLMKKILLISFLLPIIAVSQNLTPYKVNSIKAFLFYNENKHSDKDSSIGKMSENIIDNKNFVLWNTVSGGGSAKGISNQSLIVVEISGNPEGYTERSVCLTIASDGKTILKKTQDFSILDDKSKYRACFLFYDFGCTNSVITAEILNKQIVESKMIKKLNFECGE